MNTAMWLERRLHLTLGFQLCAARLYGIEVNDPLALAADGGGAGRCSFLGEHRDVYEMIAGAAGVLARSFDAAAVVTTGWAAPVGAGGSLDRPASGHPDRRRVRAVTVVDDGGVASVIRFEDDPTRVVAEADRGTGEIVDALERIWFGTAPNSRPRLVNMRTTRGGCTRRP